ncbi:hypothetical protein MSAN_00377000 [Mycena sanguinolenta]|uniref:Uncharacterized protein n=1 Tax=Mycena sanguinolenta TaxID=230812 RepID=A0A8H6ZCE2_9AGAR|nr:hypothetical protein MSAN_00377000 [Mycena sanguinolenta]
MNNPYATSDFTANNPFVPDPQSRYPDLNGPPAHDPSAAQFTNWMQPGAQSPMGMQNQPQMFQQQQFQQQQFSPGGYLPQQQEQGFAPQSPSGFQPMSSFGQQLAGQVNGSSYGYLQGQSTPAVSPGYNPVQQQLQNNPGYIAQFDPYASIGQGWDGSQQQQQQQQISQGQPSNMAPSQVGSPAPFTTSPTGQLHPREYLRQHKAEIESWDTYAWKQLLGTFDALKDAWEARKKEVEGNIAQLQQQMQYGGYYASQVQQEIGRLQAMAKNYSVAASSFQMHEVFANYRQSSDLASKQRVREASNAAITSLPDWPPLTY